MPLGANPPTLLEAQDILITADFREKTRRETPARPPCGVHDFLVLSPRPDLTPGFFANAERAGLAYS